MIAVVANGGAKYSTPLTGNEDMTAPFDSLLENSVAGMARPSVTLLRTMPETAAVSKALRGISRVLTAVVRSSIPPVCGRGRDGIVF